MQLSIMSSTKQNKSGISMCFHHQQQRQRRRQQQQQQQQQNHFVQGGSSPSSNSFQSGGDGFHSPIVSGNEYGYVQIEGDNLPMMPQIPVECSLELRDHKPSLDRLEQDLELALKSIDGAQEDGRCCDGESRTYTANREANRNHVPIRESIPSRVPSLSNEETVEVIPIDGFASDCKFHDIELMEEALLVLIGNEEKKHSHSDNDGCDGDHHQPTMRNYYKTNKITRDSAASVPVQTCDDTKTTISYYPGLLPQVTFDEEEELDRRTFFEEPFEEEYHTKVDPKGPSHWLLHDLVSDNPSFPHYTTNKSEVDRDEVDSQCNRASKGTKHKHWTEGEDETLKLAMDTDQEGKPTNWVRIARNYFSNSRSATQCKNRWKNHLQPGVVRGNWQKSEDKYITIMRSQGFKWLDIAKGLPGRTSEHVRERYVNVLDDNLKKTSWTEEEDKILFENQRRLGNKWCEIRRLLPGRSDNMIKNRYYNKRNAHMRRLKRDASKKHHSSLVSQKY